MACSPAFVTSAAPASTQIDFATAVKERHADRLMSIPAVLGVGVGSADDDPNEAVIVLYLQQGRVHPALPDVIEGVRVKVVRTDRIVAMDGTCPK